MQKPEDKPVEKASEAKVQAAEGETVRDRNGHLAKVIRMHEKLERPEVLIGSTYKIKTPISDHAMYVTINDIVLNEGTEYEQLPALRRSSSARRTSITSSGSWRSRRIISAVFAQGGDVTFLVDELKAVFDPRGGLLAGPAASSCPRSSPPSSAT